MTDYLNKSFTVYPGKDGGEKYRDNWDRIFKKKADVTEDTGPDVETTAPMNDEGYKPKGYK